MEKIQGVKNFGNEGEGRFREILSCPPPLKMRVAHQMPPQIPRPGAATANVPPVVQPERRMPFHLRNKVANELKRLKENDVIEDATDPHHG